MKYFAYGANMNHEKMRSRSPGSQFLGRAKLDSYQFVYNGKSKVRGGGVGNIVPKKGSVVWGGLYEITQEDLVALDEFEWYPNYYQRKNFVVKDDLGKAFEAMAYYREVEKPNPPYESYRAEVLQGAKDCGLPEDYINQNL